MTFSLKKMKRKPLGFRTFFLIKYNLYIFMSQVLSENIIKF